MDPTYDVETGPSCVELISPDGVDISITPLGNDVGLIRYGCDLDATLLVFRKDPRKKARLIKLHNVREGLSIGKTWIAIFTRILSYDNNRLPTQVRNIMFPIVRQNCPEFFKGEFDNENGTFRYSMYKSLLTIHNHRNEGVMQINYVKLTRGAKDGLK